MTLGQFIDFLSENPFYIISFFALLPLTAFLSGILGKNEGHETPWKYLYSTLIYLVCVPGIFSFTLNVYLFLFERQSIFEADIYTQVLPIFSMVVTLLLIRNNVSLERIPGFEKLSGLILMILVVIIFMWFIDRTRIIVFSYLSFGNLLLIFTGLLLLFRFGWSNLLKPSKKDASN